LQAWQVLQAKRVRGVEREKQARRKQAANCVPQESKRAASGVGENIADLAVVPIDNTEPRRNSGPGSKTHNPPAVLQPLAVPAVRHAAGRQ
jgi:hypothetical protein